MATRDTPHRQSGENRKVQHLLTLQPKALDMCCACIARAIHDIWRQRVKPNGYWPSCVSVYVDDGLRVYLVPNTHPNFEFWAEKKQSWWIGTYKGSEADKPESRARVMRDLTDAIREDIES